MSPWSWAILICLLVALIFSYLGNLKDCRKISSILLLAFFGTRLITEFVSGQRFMFDVSNDILAVLLLVTFVRNSFIARGIILFYALMTVFAYGPSILGLLSIHMHHIIVDVFAFFQIFILFGGSWHGFLSRSRNTLKHTNYGMRSRSLSDCSEPSRFFRKSKNGSYNKIPVIIKKNGKVVTRYAATMPYRSQF